MAGRKARKRVEVAMRRRMVARLYLDGRTQRETAAVLQVSHSTISRDLSYLTNLWRQQALSDIEIARRRELAELEEMEGQCAVGFRRDRDPRWIDLRVKLKKRKAKLLGLDRPEPQEPEPDFRVPKRLSEQTSTEQLIEVANREESKEKAHTGAFRWLQGLLPDSLMKALGRLHPCNGKNGRPATSEDERTKLPEP